MENENLLEINRPMYGYHVNYSRNGSVIKIISYSDNEKQYIAQPKLGFIQFITDLGGLFGFYLGLSLLDLTNSIQKLLNKVTHFLVLIYQIELFNIFIILVKMVLKKIIELINYIKIINWQLIFKLLTFTVMSYQICYLVYDYFQFPMETKVEFVDYVRNGTKYSISDFPAITVCTNNIFEDMFFRTEYSPKFYEAMNLTYLRYIMSKPRYEIKKFYNYNNLKKYFRHFNYLNKTITNKLVKYLANEYLKPIIHSGDHTEYRFILKYFVANNIDEFRNKSSFYLNLFEYGLNNTMRLFNFLSNKIHFFAINYGSNYYISIPRKNKHISQFGFCNTFNYSENYLDKLIAREIRLVELEDRGLAEEPSEYWKTKYILHDKNSFPMSGQTILPHLGRIKDREFTVKIIAKELLMLPWPYETDCHDYGKGSRFDCINKCYLKKYHDAFGCVPNEGSYYTLFLEKGSTKMRFCQKLDEIKINNLNENLEKFCHIKCKTQCLTYQYEHVIYENNLTNYINIRENHFKMFDTFYTRVIYDVKITIVYLVINIVNTMGLWHGVSFIAIYEIFSTNSKLITYTDKMIKNGGKIKFICPNNIGIKVSLF